ncbi:MAG: isochorismate synthase [Gammaproteobacteria bacterium]|nr:isochorismate synthase [Gammaproteobacteria bacterium]
MTFPENRLAPLRRRLQALLASVPDEHPDALLSVTVPWPELRDLHPVPAGDDGVYWARPALGQYRLGAGRAARFTTRGARRLPLLERTLRRWRSHWRHLNPDGLPLAPHAFLAFAFDADDRCAGPWSEFPNAMAQVPELLLQRSGDTCGITFTTPWPTARAAARLADDWCDRLDALLRTLREPAQPAACPTPLARTAWEPGDGEWLDRVAAAQAAMADGRLEKVVLSRRVRVQAPHDLQLPRLLAALAYRHPCCTHLAINMATTTLLAATPERLAVLAGREVESDALAGTTPRAPDESVDGELGERLLADPKSRAEHRLVVEAVAAALAPLCEDVAAPAAPVLAKLRSLQHLWTPVRGRLRNGAGLLDLAAQLHPTPAVGGTPRASVLAWLQDNGESGRGWYTGAAGWMDAAGDGELSVILRCALVQGARAELFAGAGIVADSDSAGELEETELKLQAMLEVLADG